MCAALAVQLHLVIYHELVNVQVETLDHLRRAWTRIADRYPAYDLLLPGASSFVCQAEECDAHCCRTFSVPVGEADARRMQTVTGLQLVDFLESVDGKPIELPLAEPYLLARSDNACKLLADDLGCSQYAGRPSACRAYPHQVLYISAETGRPVALAPDLVESTIARSCSGASDVFALLLRHLECPGFTGPPLSEQQWADLLLQIATSLMRS
jgi:Fe-S-cluster containining protein